MTKKILMTFSLVMFTLSIFIFAAPPPGEKGEESLEDKCHKYCRKYSTLIEYGACYNGCVNGPK